jgi:exopolysaccharide biosynthesis polyprenyl glycosylphosphotransferase
MRASLRGRSTTAAFRPWTGNAGAWSIVVGPALAGIVVAYLSGRISGGVVAALAFSGVNVVARKKLRWLALLPLAGALVAILYPVAQAVTVVLAQDLFSLPVLTVQDVAVLVLATTVLSMLPRLGARSTRIRRRAIRVLVVGPQATADALACELTLRRIGAFEVIGCVSDDDPPVADGTAKGVGAPLGPLGHLRQSVVEHEADLITMAEDRSTAGACDDVIRACLTLPVRVCTVLDFYERVLGHVPLSEISANWFRYIMHPSFCRKTPLSKRVVDVLVASLVGLITLPLLLVFAMLIRRDGGPALFRQQRVGEGGRTFVLYKLRTMRMEAPLAAQWASADDPRITRIGRFLRRTHLDELPQVINVIRGDMSLVGPRPEQPSFVLRLERLLPYYDRRHLIKPGVTGWAQVRCGYAGSDVGSAWKLCHDLFYVKHRTLSFDFLILAETFRTVFGNPHRVAERRKAPLSLVNVFGDEVDGGVATAPDDHRAAHGQAITATTS